MLRFTMLTRALLISAVACCLSGLPGASANETPVETFKQLKEFEARGEWDKAIETLKAQPGNDATYFYNLGSLYLREGNSGLAVAYLEKANHQEPHNPVTQQNLGLARRALEKKLGTTLDSASNWSESIADRVSIDEVRGALGLFGCIVVLFWMRSYLKTRRLRQTLAQPAAILSMLGFAVTISLYAMERYASEHPPACLLKKESIRSGPADRFLELGQLPEGAKVRVLGAGTDESSTETWAQVRFADSSVGWVRSSSLLQL